MENPGVTRTILCIGPTPAAQRVMVFSKLAIDAVNRAVTTLDGAAGKSINVAKVLKTLGEQPLATGFLGGPRGKDLLHILRQRHISSEFVGVAESTRQCITVINEVTGQHTELVEESRPVSAAAYGELWRIIERRMASSRAAVMSGTITPGGPLDSRTVQVRWRLWTPKDQHFWTRFGQDLPW
jgi:tagatose 6-phosphate kinase